MWCLAGILHFLVNNTLTFKLPTGAILEALPRTFTLFLHFPTTTSDPKLRCHFFLHFPFLRTQGFFFFFTGILKVFRGKKFCDKNLMSNINSKHHLFTFFQHFLPKLRGEKVDLVEKFFIWKLFIFPFSRFRSIWCVFR